MIWLYVFIGGGLGSVSRYGISRIFMNYSQNTLPWSTIISNVLACILLAFLMLLVGKKTNNSDLLIAFLGIGFCGGFSTFSTFSLENVQFIQNGSYGLFLLNVIVSLALGVGVMFAILKSGGFESAQPPGLK